MTREEAINEINKVFTSAYANYIVTALTEGATVSDIQHRWGRAYEAGVKDGLEQKPCEDAVSRKSVITIIQNHWWNCRDIDKLVNELPPVTPQEQFKPMVEIDLYSVIKQKYVEREVLDKISAEIEEAQTYDGIYIDRAYVLEIIDKYKAESEGVE